MQQSDVGDLKALVEYMVKAIVGQPDQVVVREVVGERTTVLKLTVAQTDVGYVLGRSGRNALALRTILNCAATKFSRRAVLEVENS